jgi:hypothetical protein
MDPFTRRSGPWTVTHVPAGHSAYDRVLGRMTSWSLEVSHDSGWLIVSSEGSTTAHVFSRDGLLVGVIEPDDYAQPYPNPLAATRSQLLMDALTAWTHRHAAEYGEPAIDD